MKIIVMTLALILLAGSMASAKKVTYRKTQNVSFDGDDVEGVKRNPYGAYLAQKRGVDFGPLYNIRQKFETNIKSSSEYIK
jgi:hypothetical protein